MPRFMLAVFAVLFWTDVSPAGERTAVVHGSTWRGRGRFTRVECSMRLESVLRDAGYRLLNRAAREQAHLQVSVSGSCWNTRLHEHKCSFSASVHRRGGRGFGLDAHTQSAFSRDAARDDACRELANQLRSRLGAKKRGSLDRDDDLRPVKKEKASHTVVVRWQGELKPMPLVKLTGYFKKVGYQAALKKGGPHECRFRVTTADPREQVEHELRLYLESLYAVKRLTGKGIRFQLGPMQP